jgi:hypothetical protein
MSKNLVKTEGAQMTSQYGAHALQAGKARLHARTRMHTPTRPGTRKHARTHAQACTHKPISNTAFPRQQWFAMAPLCYIIRTLPVLLASGVLHGVRAEFTDVSTRNSKGWIVVVLNPGRAEERFSAPVQTSPGAHPASCRICSRSLFRG